MSKTVHFKSREAYRKWLAYNWIHNKRQMGRPPNKRVVIRGKVHKVSHKK